MYLRSLIPPNRQKKESKTALQSGKADWPKNKTKATNCEVLLLRSLLLQVSLRSTSTVFGFGWCIIFWIFPWNWGGLMKLSCAVPFGGCVLKAPKQPIGQSLNERGLGCPWLPCFLFPTLGLDEA